MKTSFKRYKRSFKCRALPTARKSVKGRKAAAVARRAAKSGRVEQAYQRLLTATAVGFDGLEHHLVSPRKAAELLADSLLYEEKLRNRKRYDERKVTRAPSARKRWGIYPTNQAGEPGDTPIQVCGTKHEAEQRAAQISTWGKRQCVVLPYPHLEEDDLPE